MTARFEIQPLLAIDEEITGLIEAANDEGFIFMETLRRQWLDGSNRFDRPGEVYLLVRQQGLLVAAGGINCDPYCDNAGTGRVRHVYVHKAARRSGAGRFLIGQIISLARGTFDRVRLRTRTTEGAAFYEAIGFARSDEDAATHVLRF